MMLVKIIEKIIHRIFCSSTNIDFLHYIKIIFKEANIININSGMASKTFLINIYIKISNKKNVDIMHTLFI